MPVYNSGVYLDVAVKSILVQSLTDFELILVDDGSTDGSSERCDYYQSVDTRVKVIHQKNRGICNARNAALKIAKGEYVGFSDHDDEFVPDSLSMTYQVAVDNQADVVKFRKKEFIYREGRLIRTKEDLFPNLILDKEGIRNDIFFLKNAGVLNCVWDGLYKRTFFDKYHFDSSYRTGGEDIAFMYSIVPNITKLILLDKVFYFHYIRRGFSTSTKFNIDNINSKVRLCQQKNTLLRELGIDREQYIYDYTYYLIRFVYCPVVAILANSSCPYSLKEKIDVVKEMLNEDYTPSYFLEQSSLDVFKRSKKLGIAYFMLKKSLYKSLFTMFRVRLKYS